MSICNCTKNDGMRCTRTVKADGNKRYCWQHQECKKPFGVLPESPIKVAKVAKPEPDTSTPIPTPIEGIKKIIKVVKETVEEPIPIYKRSKYIVPERRTRGQKRSGDKVTNELGSAPFEADILLSNLIKGAFKLPYPRDDIELMEFMKEASQLKDSEYAQQIQIVEIATNEGTVKPFIPASLTELVQNSIDAIRQANAHGQKVSPIINIYLARSPDYKYLFLSIKDYVGMNESAFLHISIPFVSTKTPSEIVTGEMGTGFFNVYRGSDMVIINTTKDGIRRQYIDEPIRDSNNRVIDIKKNVTLRAVPKEIADFGTSTNGTEITMVIPTNLEDTGADKESDPAFIEMVSDIKSYCYNVIGLAQLDKIYFMGNNVHVPRKLVYSTNRVEIYLLNVPEYITNPGTKKYDDSYLLTKGIPFDKLLPYLLIPKDLEKTVEFNCIVNILHGSYTPVQTRTKITLSPEAEKDFITISQNVAFVTALRESMDPLGSVTVSLDHMKSKGQAQQLKFAQQNDPLMWKNPSDFLKYVRFDGQVSVVELINGCIDILGDAIYYEKHNEINKYIRETYKPKSTTVLDYVNLLVLGWIEPKNTNLRAQEDALKAELKLAAKKAREAELKKLEEEGELHEVSMSPEEIAKMKAKEQKKIDEIVKDIKKEPKPFPPEDVIWIESFIKNWVSKYIELLKKAGISGSAHMAPKATIINDPEDHSAGFYTLNKNEIVINIYTWEIESLKDFIKLFKANGDKQISQEFIETLDNNEIWRNIFAMKMPASTLIHEIEHWRRRDAGMHGIHGSISYPLYENDLAQTRSFDESANAVYRKVIESGFYSELYNKPTKKIIIKPTKKT